MQLNHAILEAFNGVQIQGHVTMTSRYQWNAVADVPVGAGADVNDDVSTLRHAYGFSGGEGQRSRIYFLSILRTPDHFAMRRASMVPASSNHVLPPSVLTSERQRKLSASIDT